MFKITNYAYLKDSYKTNQGKTKFL